MPDNPETFAKARQVHTTLRRIWTPAMKDAGFRAASSSACAFAKERTDQRGFVTFGVQISAWGDSWSGNEFTINAAGAASKPSDYYQTVFRPLAWLTVEDCAAGVEIERRVRARFPTPPPDHEVWTLAAQSGNVGEVFRKALAALHVVHERMWRPGCDIWLPYFGTADVHEWGAFLLPILPKLLSRVEQEGNPLGS